MSKLGVSEFILSYRNRVVVIDGRSGVARTIPNPTAAGANNNGQLVLSGSRVVLTEGGHAWLLDDDLSGAATDLGPAIRVIPASEPGKVWLFRSGITREGIPSGGGLFVVQVDLPTLTRTALSPLPDGMFPAIAVERFLVLNPRITGSASTQVWDPVSRTTVTALGPGPAVSTVVIAYGSSGALIAWTGGGCSSFCPVHLTNLNTHTDRIVGESPPSPGRSCGDAAVSPDGKTLAVALALDSNAPRCDLAVIDLATSRMRLLTTAFPTHQAFIFPHLAWTPSGRWLVAYTDGGDSIRAWHLGSSEMKTVAGLIPPSVADLATPSGQTASYFVAR